MVWKFLQKKRSRVVFDDLLFLRGAESIQKRFLVISSESFMLRWSAQLQLSSEIEHFLWDPFDISEILDEIIESMSWES